MKVLMPKYEPLLDLSEAMIYNLGDRKIGENIKIVVDYEVIEKTRNYVMLRINFAFLETNKRVL